MGIYISVSRGLRFSIEICISAPWIGSTFVIFCTYDLCSESAASFKIQYR